MRSLPTRLLGVTVSGVLLACLSAAVNPTPALADTPPSVVGGKTVVTYPLKDAVHLTVDITTTVDSDHDGKLDKVQLRIERPNTAPGVKVPIVIEPGPYNNSASRQGDDYHPKRVLTDGTPATLPSPFTFPVPVQTTGFPRNAPLPTTWDLSRSANDKYMDNFLVPLGYAFAELDALGTGNSDGCLGVGDANEQAGVKAAIDWLNGRATGVIDGTTTQVTATDWFSGKAALEGRSYDGALAIEGAASRVAGLTTIVDNAGMADWYAYERANGAVVSPGAGYVGYDLDSFAAEHNTGPSYATCDNTITKELITPGGYSTGDRSNFFDQRNYTTDAKAPQSPTASDPNGLSVFVIQGIRDDSVRPDNSTTYWQKLQDWGIKSKLWLTQDEHKSPYQINGLEFLTQLHKWYDYWLYGLTANNDVMDAANKVTVQNSDFTWSIQSAWPATGTSSNPGGANVTLTTHVTGTGTASTRTLTSGPANYAVGKADSMTMATGTDAAGNPLSGHDALTNSDHMDLNNATLNYLTPKLTSPATLEGIPKFQVEAASSGASPYLDALLVDFGPQTNTLEYADEANSTCLYTVEGLPAPDPNLATATNTGCETLRTPVAYTASPDGHANYRVISRGWLDMRNYGGSYNADPNDYAEQVVPDSAYRVYNWDGEPLETTVAAGHQIGLILLPVDTRNQPQYIGPNGDMATKLSIATEMSSVTLPVKSGAATLG
ncbi:CocE/NonD family hydrolase [Kitasatospora indigofera]|uniref:CocE/NonD family hydrolase n=1 Tax=Kitasatospora indigofera TaxID=67307 RepID=UPI00367E5F6E